MGRIPATQPQPRVRNPALRTTTARRQITAGHFRNPSPGSRRSTARPPMPSVMSLLARFGVFGGPRPPVGVRCFPPILQAAPLQSKCPAGSGFGRGA